VKRRVVLLLLLLVAGAIVNIAVAWGCALCVHPRKSVWVRAQRSAPENVSRRDPEFKSLSVVRASRPGATDIEITWVHNTFFPYVDESPLSLVPAWTGLHETSALFNTGAAAAEISIAEMRGWPMPALWTSHTNTFPIGTLKVRYGLQTPWTRLSSAINGVPYKLALPLQPIWPGFAINTVFYAVTLWLLLVALFAVRGWRRIKRGLCPKCAYDLRNRPSDSSVCPECGAMP